MNKQTAQAALLVLLWAAASCVPGRPAREADDLRREEEVTSFAGIGSQLVLAAARRYPKTARAAAPPPVSLTTSDGTGLSLVSYRAKAVIDGPLAFTELSLRFRNPRAERIEGRFAVSLPSGAAVSRLAMRIGERWQEAEVVEKQKARRSYEAVLHRGFDPALLEKKAGNAFSARIFPIEASADKEIILSYSHDVERGRYELPLAGLPLVEELDVEAQVRANGDWSKETMSDRHVVPSRDFTVPVPAERAGLRHGNLIALRLRPTFDEVAQPLRRVAVLFDTSASRALGFERSVRRLEALLAALAKRHGEETHVELAAFDQEVAPVYAGTLAGLGDDTVGEILARRPLGASDLHAAMGWLGRRAGLDRAIVITDAVATAGPAETTALLARLGAARQKVRRLDVVLSGGITDRALARRLAAGPLVEDGAVLDASLPAAELARRISLATKSGIIPSVDGAKWVWPERLDGMQPGDEAVVFAHLELLGGSAVDVTLGGSIEERVTIPLRPANGPLLARAATAALIARISDRLAKQRPGVDRDFMKNRIVELSTEYRVLSDYTALLVLETDSEYARFGIDPNALADVLVVDDTGVVARDRDAPVLADVGSGNQPLERHRTLDPIDVTQSAQRDERHMRLKPKTRRLIRTEVRNLERLLEDDDDDDDEGYGYEFEDDPLSPPSTDVLSPKDRAQMDPEAVARFDMSELSLSRDRLDIPSPYVGRMAEVMGALQAPRCDLTCIDGALVRALAWRNDEPGDAMAVVALGEALEKRRQIGLAARAYGSLLDLYVGRAEMLRFAAGRLERLGRPGARLARQAYDRSLEDRPDHLTAHRARAFALLRSGQPARAFAALQQGFRSYPPGRFAGGIQVLRQDLGLVAAAWLRADPVARGEIMEQLAARGAQLAKRPSVRFVLSWETDANDVDLHVFDAELEHAYHGQRWLASGGRLHHDVIDGFGPELFAIERPRAYPYRLAVHYYDRGPMGYGMGKVEIVHHDGKGRLRFEQRPFVVMRDDAFVDLGTVEPPTW